MNGRSRNGWAVLVFGLLIALAVGYGAYNLGVSHGVAISAPPAVSPAPGAAPVPPYPYYYPYGWHHHWGFGFFPFFPLLAIVFWLFVARAFFFQGRHWHDRDYERGKPDQPVS
jgi:hypothetical protein